MRKLEGDDSSAVVVQLWQKDGGEDNDDDDYDDIYIMMKCLYVTKNEHFLSARAEREARSEMPARPYQL